MTLISRKQNRVILYGKALRASYHHHFKIITGLSPLKFQKQLQHQEARRLMLSEDLDTTTAGFQVGYNDASHFYREYK